jgi:hypothetical protein
MDLHSWAHCATTPERDSGASSARYFLTRSRTQPPNCFNAATMPSSIFWYTLPSNLASHLLAALVCYCLLLQHVQCLPANRDASHRERRAIVLVSDNDSNLAATLEIWTLLELTGTHWIHAQAESVTQPPLTIVQTPTNSSVPGSAYLGCFIDSQPSSLVLPSATPRYLLNGISYTSTTSLTWAACGSFCSSYQFFGLSAGSTCRCGNSFTFSPGPSLDTSCQISCSGSSPQACGGSTRSTVFLNSNLGNNISPVGQSSSVTAATLPQPMTLQQLSGVVSLASVVSRSSLLPLSSSVIQVSTATQLVPVLQNLVAPLFGTTSLPSAITLPTSIPFVAALPSTSSTRLAADVASTIALSAVAAQLVPVQSAIALFTPTFPARVPGMIVSSFTQAPTPAFTTFQILSGAAASQNLAPSSAQLAPILSSVAAPAAVSLATTQPVVPSPNLVGQLAPVISVSPSPPLSTTPSAQLSTPAMPGPIFSPAASGFPATALLGPSSPPLPLVPSDPNVLGLLPSSSPTLTSTLFPWSVVGLINDPLLLPLVGAVTSSPAPVLNVLPATPTRLVGTLSSLPAAVPIQPSASAVAVEPGAVGFLPTVLSVSQLLAPPRQPSVTAPLQGVPPLTAAQPPLETTPLLAPIPAIPLSQPFLGSSSAELGVGSVVPAVIPISQTLAAVRPPIVTVPLNVNPIPTTVEPPLAATSFIVAPLPLATPASLLPAVPQLDTVPLTAAPALPTSIPLVVGNSAQEIASSVSSVASEVPWWVITEFLEPHGLPAPPIFATPPPLALPALPAVEEPNLPVNPTLSPLLGSSSTNTALGTVPAESTVPQVIESGTVIDKVYTWSLYADGSAQVNGTLLSPERGPIQAYLSDGTRIGMDSAGLYIGWEHRVPYPPEFLQIIRGYLLPPPQLLL